MTLSEKPNQLIVLKSLHRLFWCCQLDRILGSRRLAGLGPASKTLAKYAYRTEFHRSGKLVTACNLRRKQHHAPPGGAKAASTTPGILLSRSTSDCVFLYSSPQKQVSEQNSYRRCPAGRLVLITSFGNGAIRI